MSLRRRVVAVRLETLGLAEKENEQLNMATKLGSVREERDSGKNVTRNLKTW